MLGFLWTAVKEVLANVHIFVCWLEIVYIRYIYEVDELHRALTRIDKKREKWKCIREVRRF